MRGTLALLCLYAVAGAQQRASLETKTERDTYYVQEPFRVTLRIGIDGDYFEKHVVQMFQRITVQGDQSVSQEQASICGGSVGFHGYN